VDACLPQLLPLLLARSSSLRGLPLLLVNLPLQWIRSTVALAILISVGFRNEGHRKLHTLWLMPAPGRCQSVNDWTIVSSLLAGSRGSAVNCRPTTADYYQQLVPSWNRKSSKFRLHASSSPVHRWSITLPHPKIGGINSLEIQKSRYLWAPSASHWDTRLPSEGREKLAVNVVPQDQLGIRSAGIDFGGVNLKESIFLFVAYAVIAVGIRRNHRWTSSIR